MTSETDWEEYIKYYTYCYNCSPHTSLNCEYTPFELVFGKPARELDILSEGKIDPLYNLDNYAKHFKFKIQNAHRHAKMLLENSKLTYKKYYDKKAIESNFKIGENVIVTVEDRQKHGPMYKGPYKITHVDDQNVTVDIKNKPKLIHKNRIKHFNV